ncbi:MAG: hypothetical protein COV36_07725 [Alphaproteobacteria bacterium CG11_big_fil_rev_8_21_14_0_20_44_7]|nr:MAG: hypothetical protein COV36_07725 [Alphaproteobacteria bacterium CG11_big_fil_rev_8_21_14_0_20_44_7]
MFQGLGSKACSPELLATIADVVNAAVAITRSGNFGIFDHKLVYANRAFTELTGYEQNDIMGRSPEFLYDQRSSGEVINKFFQNCRRGENFSIEFDSFKKGGSEQKLALDVTPVIDEFQGTSHYIMVFKKVAAEASAPAPQESQEAQEEVQPSIAEEATTQQDNTPQATAPTPLPTLVDEAECEAEDETEIAEDEAKTLAEYDSILEEIEAELRNISDTKPQEEIAEEIVEEPRHVSLSEEELIEKARRILAGKEEETDIEIDFSLDDDEEVAFEEVAEEVAEEIEEAEPVAALEEEINTEEATDQQANSASEKDELASSPYAIIEAELGERHSTIEQIINSIEKKKNEEVIKNERIRQVREESVDGEHIDKDLDQFAKTRFLSNMCHDLRTPLNAIIGFSEVIRDQLFGPIDNPRYTSYANDIFRSGQELLATVSEILELSEIEETDTEMEEEDFIVNDTLNEVLDLLSARAFQSDVKIMKKLDENDLKFRGDRRKIKQAFAGVIGNAIKSSPSGGKVELTSTREENGDYSFVVYIKSANLIAAKSSLGSLLGTVTNKVESEYPEISLAKKFVEAHDGHFTIFNSATSGTEITILLPAQRIVEAPTQKAYLKVIN